MLDEVFNDKRPDRLAEYWIAAIRGEAERLHEILFEAFPDLHVRIDDMIAEGDRVVVRLWFTGTHDGQFQGLPATGRHVEFGAIRIYRLADGQVTETWAYQDAAGLLQQLG
ncbi:ester cyclase [Nocardia transvalensis]|uniref:ester cyclase n=1 Tax=Nocardia transvalensis TaxID=37333 RepID=UPI0018941FFF|nr:ester cyclase [Nocardia transvalensis]MBF6331897.1 ester cyclase [Nocardia transvalensis]